VGVGQPGTGATGSFAEVRSTKQFSNVSRAGGTLVPTTFGGHRFWELSDASQRAQQQMHFLKNAAILRGLLVVALD
jgi:hypothetical protein